MDQGHCQCGATSEPFSYQTYVEYISVAVLRARGWEAQAFAQSAMPTAGGARYVRAQRAPSFVRGPP